jgi:hypothetical protein
VWQLVRDNLEAVLPIGLPVLFLLTTAFGKWVFGKKDFADLGADIAWAALTIFLVTLLRQVLRRELSDTRDVATGIVFAFLFFLSWFACLALSYRRLPRPYFSAGGQVVLARLLGSFALYWSLTFTLAVTR